jgi:hypothetical protein
MLRPKIRKMPDRPRSRHWLSRLFATPEIATKVFGFGSSLVSLMGFLVFLRYCLEISYFPELTLSAFAGFFAAIFILSLFIVIVFLLLWYQSSIPVKDALRQSEGFQKEGKLFVMQIYGWIIISLVYPSLILIVVFGTNPQGYKGDWQVPFLLALCCAVSMGISLPFSSRVLSIKLDGIKPLPWKLTMKLCAFGGIWVFFGFCVAALAYLMWGLIAMSVAIYGACLLLIFSMV